MKRYGKLTEHQCVFCRGEGAGRFHPRFPCTPVPLIPMYLCVVGVSDLLESRRLAWSQPRPAPWTRPPNHAPYLTCPLSPVRVPPVRMTPPGGRIQQKRYPNTRVCVTAIHDVPPPPPPLHGWHHHMHPRTVGSLSWVTCPPVWILRVG